jgi:hypothetical protein
MKKSTHKLVLSKDSLRKLTREELDGVAGDSPIYTYFYCPTLPPICK